MPNNKFYPAPGKLGAVATVSYPMLRYYKITDGTVVYHCYAQAGAALTSKQWMIARVDETTGSTKFPYLDDHQLNSFVWAISDTSSESDILDTIKNYPYNIGEGFNYDFDFDFE